MPKYVLECPECETRFELKKYAPEKRVRCRKCRKVVEIPYAPGDAPPPEAKAKPLPPDLHRKVVKALSLRKLALLSGLLALALAGACYLLIRKGETARAPEVSKKPPEVMTLMKATEMKAVLGIPLKSGVSWEYALTDGTVERRMVGTASDSVNGGPEFSLGITGPGAPVTQTLRVLMDGIYLVSEQRPAGKATFQPPLRLVPIPLYLDDHWTYEGECVREGAAPEKWSLEFATSRSTETLESRLEKFRAFRVDVRGKRGTEAVEESRWYSLGKGLVKRQTRLPGGALEEAILTRYTVP